jgi:hypothetical protein
LHQIERTTTAMFLKAARLRRAPPRLVIETLI